jgi:hypothetical protein
MPRRFVTTLDQAKLALDECYKSFSTSSPPKDLEMNKFGPDIIGKYGKGRWHQISSMYYECGVNETEDLEEEQLQDQDALGTLSEKDMDELEDWFMLKKLPKAKVLPAQDKKRNFTVVLDGRAFNFHVGLH